MPRNILFTAAAAILVWLLTITASTQAVELVRVAIYNNPPLISSDQENQGQGIFAKILSRIAEEEGWELLYVPGPFQKSLSRLTAGEVDILCAVAFTNERAALFPFSRENVLTNWGQVYTPSDSKIRDLTDLEGKRVILLKGDIHNQVFRETLDRFGIGCQMEEVNDYRQIFEILSKGRAHAGVVNRFYGQQHCDRYGVVKSGVIFNPISLHFAFRPDIPPEIITIVDRHLASMKTDPQSDYYRAIETGLNQPVPGFSFPDWAKTLAGSTLALMILLFMGNLILGHKVREKTRALTRELNKRKEVESNLRTTLHSIGEGVIATDAEGRVFLMNQLAQDLTGWPLDQAMGLTLSTIFHVIDNTKGMPLPDPVAQVMMADKPVQLPPDAILISRTGNQYQIRDSASPIRDDNGRIRGVVMVFRDVSQSARLQESIAQNEEYLGSILRAAPIGIGVVSDRHITHVNQKVLDITGYSEEELLGQSSRILYPNDSEYAYVGREKYRQINMAGTGTVETLWQKKDGSNIHVLLSSTPMDPANLSKGVTFSALDITQRKEAELLLKKNEKQYRTLFEKTNDAIFLMAPETGIFIDANTAALTLTGRSLDELRQTRIQDITESQNNIPVSSVLSGSAKTLGEFFFTHPDSNQRIARLNIVHLSNDMVIGIARDVTQDRHMENQLRQAQKMESIGTLAGGIAHDFNNILFPILGFAEMLLEDTPEEGPMSHGLNQIYASAMRAKELVGQILAFSRQSKTEPLPMKIQPIIKEALKLIRSTIPTTIDIQQTISKDCGVIKSDPTQVHQIILNLTTNAYHAMEETGGTLTVTLEKARIMPDTSGVTDLPPGEYACLTVADTGPGIPEEIQHSIFDPFFTTKEKGKGTGMGLSVVHGIVVSMGGGIQVNSKEGKGAAFIIYFPLVERESPLLEQSISLSLPRGNERVLLVDDEPEIISMEKQLLERLGYKVHGESKSTKALELFAKAPNTFDLVISDVAMPGMAGDRLAKELLKIRPDIPILLCTGFSETMTEEKAMAIGVQGFILKPMVIKELSKKIRKILGPGS